MKIDTIEFRVELCDFEREKRTVVNIFINGKNLINIIRNIELHQADNVRDDAVAGNYAGLSPRELWDEIHSEYQEKTVLNCTCGCEGCWDLLAEIGKTEKYVIWRNFQQPHRPKWDYSQMKPYHFDKAQYNTELEKLKNYFI
jgi:fructose 1,6-bisphosphatase